MTISNNSIKLMDEFQILTRDDMAKIVLEKYERDNSYWRLRISNNEWVYIKQNNK